MATAQAKRAQAEAEMKEKMGTIDEKMDGVRVNPNLAGMMHVLERKEEPTQATSALVTCAHCFPVTGMKVPADSVMNHNGLEFCVDTKACDMRVASGDAYIAREPRDAQAHLRKAMALEKLGRPRDAYDALLLGQRATHGDARLAFDTARLADEGMRAGWMQFSAASDEQSAARSSQPHCALCLRPTPAGRPPPEASCGVCGMVQYCCAEHCAADADKHGRQCATLQKLAWRQLWSHCMQQQAASRSRV